MPDEDVLPPDTARVSRAGSRPGAASASLSTHRRALRKNERRGRSCEMRCVQSETVLQKADGPQIHAFVPLPG